MNSAPRSNRAPSKATSPTATPPAAPIPARSLSDFPVSLSRIDTQFSSPCSKLEAFCTVTPFCGPKTATEPWSPNKLLLTSHRTTIDTSGNISTGYFNEVMADKFEGKGSNSLPEPSKKRNPKADRMPIPPSMVALPPTPRYIWRNFISSARFINSPVPNVLAL